MGFSENTNENDSSAMGFCSSLSNTGNNMFDILLFDFDNILSQRMFRALRPIDLRVVQAFSPLLEIHTNDAVFDLFECFAKAYWRLLILLSSN